MFAGGEVPVIEVSFFENVVKIFVYVTFTLEI